MLTIIIAIAVGVGLFVLAAWLCLEGKDGCEDIAAFSVVVMVGGIIAGICAPLQGYEKEAELVEEIELVTLSNSTASQGSKGIFYVSISADNVYSYRYEVEDKYGISGKSYKVGTVSDNVTEVESSKCEVPVLKIYNRKGVSGLFTFAAFTDKREYVFYVPEGTVVKTISVN